MVIPKKYLLTYSTLIICLLCVISLKAQKDGYEAPYYGKSRRSEADFIVEKLASAIQKTDCRTEDSLLLSKFTAMLTINENGIVDSVAFQDFNVSSACSAIQIAFFYYLFN